MCTTITLILVAVSILSGANIAKITKDLESELTIIVYLDHNATDEDVENITADLKSQKNIDSIEFISKEKRKIKASKYDEEFGNLLNYMEENPLLDSFVIKVKNIKKMDKTADYIKTLNKIDSVKYGKSAVETYISAFDVIEKVVIIVVIALIIVTSFLISNTIKLTIFSRRNEIEIRRLVGSSNITIKLPFLIEGFIIGILGSIIPICITIYGYVILYTRLGGHIITNIVNLIEPYNFVFYVSLILVLIGALVGMFGSLKAVKKYLKI